MNPEPLLRWFMTSHLKAGLHPIVNEFGETANKICEMVPASAERTVALRLLIQSKDAAVRAYVEATEPA